ncbi:hypothetical protein DL93DRAFT_2163020 [Clavulina sp. PMI_390]|nr:hypothetical protein DL93DRAFT_2163020 [Clavulina sp. PMI_390]
MADDRAQPHCTSSLTSRDPPTSPTRSKRLSVANDSKVSPLHRGRRSAIEPSQTMSPGKDSPNTHRNSMSPTRSTPKAIALGIKRDYSMVPEVQPPTVRDGLRASLGVFSWFTPLLVFVPISWSFEYALRPRTSAHQAAIFITSFLAIISLATFRSWAVGELTVRVGKPLGALIATCCASSVSFCTSRRPSIPTEAGLQLAGVSLKLPPLSLRAH